MKRLAFLFVFLALVGGGAAAWWFLLREPSPEEATAEADQYAGVPTSPFIELEPMIVPVIRDGRVAQHVTLMLTVDLTEPLPLDQLKRKVPPVRDALFSELHAAYALRYVQDRGFESEFMLERLRRAAEQALGDGTVHEILIRNFQQRSLPTG